MLFTSYFTGMSNSMRKVTGCGIKEIDTTEGETEDIFTAE